MNKEDFKKLVDNPMMISGIFNYCDRWCERCTLTARCANFAIGEMQASERKDRDANNEEFWGDLHEIFQITLEMLRETMEAKGFDFEEILAEASEYKEKESDTLKYEDECVRNAKKYSELSREWFENSKELFEQKGIELEKQHQLSLPGSEPVNESLRLQDSVEVIQWYQFQIYVKLARAVRGKLEDKDDLLEGYPKDSDGSAKVALIGIDRSISAWGIMLRYFPACEDELLKILVILERLRNKTEKEFPDARSFLRPGFDEK